MLQNWDETMFIQPKMEYDKRPTASRPYHRRVYSEVVTFPGAVYVVKVSSHF
jgi:hypothetical protein